MRKENDNNCLKMNKKAQKIWQKYLFCNFAEEKLQGVYEREICIFARNALSLHRMMKILIIGGTGTISSAITRQLAGSDTLLINSTPFLQSAFCKDGVKVHNRGGYDEHSQ